MLQIVKGLDIGAESGGAERFGIELARALNRWGGFAVSVCSFFTYGTEREGYWRQRLAKEGIRVFSVAPWGGYHNATRFVHGYWRLIQSLGKSHVDICHSHFQLGSLAALLLKASGRATRAVRTAHVSKEWESGKYTWWLRNIFLKYLFPIMLDAEVGVSQALVDYLASHPGYTVSRKKPRLIYNALPDFDPSYKPRHNTKPFNFEGHYLIGSVGRLTIQKGYSYLLQAVPKVLQLFPNCQFVIIGDGELRAELDSLCAALDLKQHVHFLGAQENVIESMRQMDLFVLPSLWEGLPTVLLEAMSCGVPVIATDIEGTNELIEDGRSGWLVPPRDPNALARAIIEALKAPESRRQFAEASYKQLDRFSMSRVAAQYAALYDELLG